MTPRSFIVLALVTVVTAGAAIAAVATRPAPVSIPVDRELVFPAVASSLNEVGEMEVNAAGRSFTLQRKDDRWVLASVGDYPALFEKVRATLIQLSELRFLEAKTANEERYARLQVEPVTAPDARSTEITVRDGAGNVLGKGLIGKRVATLFGADRGGTYLRLDGERQSWLAEGTVDLGTGPADWVARSIVDVAGDRMKRLTVRAPDGGTVTVQRAEPAEDNFTLEDIPEGQKQRGQWETNQMPKALEGLTLKDLHTEGEIDFKDGTYVAEFETFDGLVIRTEAAVIDRRFWARFSASAENASGENAEEVRKQAEEINARVRGFVYEIEESPGKKLTCDHVNLLEGAGINACA
jgi:hypothetical protein